MEEPARFPGVMAAGDPEAWQSRTVMIDVYGIVFQSLWFFGDDFSLMMFAWEGEDPAPRWVMVRGITGRIDRENQRLRPEPHAAFDRVMGEEVPLPEDYEMPYSTGDGGDVLILGKADDPVLGEEIRLYQIRRLR